MALEIDLGGRVAIVTGVTDGIGAGIARMLARAGADVAGCGRSAADSQNAERFRRDVESAAARALYRPVDVSECAEIPPFVEAVIAAFGRIDMVVSNAGRNMFFGAEACTESEWRKNLDLNLASHWRLAHCCRPHLAKTRGVVEIMTSNQGYATIPGCFPYNVTKTALVGLVRSLALEWGPAIRVVGLAPGFIDTPGNDRWFAAFPDPAAERARTVRLHPAGRLGTPEELGAWCAFLASDYAAFATGATYVIDGGRLAVLQDT